MDKLRICEVQESALTVSEGEPVAHREEFELAKIRKRRLEMETEQMTQEFHQSVGSQADSPPASKKKRSRRALILETPQKGTPKKNLRLSVQRIGK